MTHAPHTHWKRLIPIMLALAAALSVLVLAFLWPTATSSVKSLPVVIAGESAQVEALTTALDDQSDGAIALTEVDDRAAAVDAIEHREAYGAIILGAQPEVLTASAASPVASQLLTSVAPELQAQLNAAVAAQGVVLAEPIAVTVTDVVPLASTDSRGALLTSAAFPLLIGGMIGGIAVSIAVVGVWRRVTAVLGYAVIGGLALAGILQGLFGALQGDYLVNAAAISLTIASISGVIIGAVALVGRAGIAVGPVLFLLIANPLSSAAAPVEFLAEPWGFIGQLMPPGAAATLLRDLSYFPNADVSLQWIVLGAWALGGLLLSVAGHFRDAGAASRAAKLEAASL